MVDIPEEGNLITQAKWKPVKIDLFKYVDDNLSSEKINLSLIHI